MDLTCDSEAVLGEHILWQALEAAISDGIANQVEHDLVAAAKQRLQGLQQQAEQDLLRQKAAEELSAATAKQDIDALEAALSKAEGCGVAEKASKRCLASEMTDIYRHRLQLSCTGPSSTSKKESLVVSCGYILPSCRFFSVG